MNKIDKLKSQFARGDISRRRFMEGALALGMTLAGATSVVSKAMAATPNKGGLFRLGLAGASTTDSLDPATYISTFTQIGMTNAVHNNLTEVAQDGNLIPELAESLGASDDARVWTFKLRKGVEFHNGKSLEADDVIASVNHHRGEDSKSAAKPLLSDLVEIKADGKNTVVFELKSGNADFPFVMNDYHIPILPSKDGTILWEDGIGTGGYTLVSMDAGVRMRLKRNPNYWKEGRAHFDEVELLGISDSTARPARCVE